MKAAEYFNKIGSLLEDRLPNSHHIELESSSINANEDGYHAGKIYAVTDKEYLIALTKETLEKYSLQVTLFETCNDVDIADMFDMYLCGSGFMFEKNNIPALPSKKGSKSNTRMIEQLKLAIDKIHHEGKIQCIRYFLPNKQDKEEDNIGQLLKAEEGHILVHLRACKRNFSVYAAIIPEHDPCQLDKYLYVFDLSQDQTIH